jgi:hypothetical protein
VTDGPTLWDTLQAEVGSPADMAPDEPAPRTQSLSDRMKARIEESRNRPESLPRKKTSTRSTVREPPAKPGEFVAPLVEFYTMAGMAVAVMDKKDQVCGPAIAESAQQCAEAWDNLAQKNPAVRKALRSLLSASAVGAIVTAHLPIMIAILTQHMPGVIPPNMRSVAIDDQDLQESSIDTEVNERRSAA